MRKLLAIILCAVMTLSLVVVGASAADPEVITTAEQFAAMTADGNYKLGADIAIAATYADTFTGTLDGDGHTITATATLFDTFAGTVKNLKIEGDINVNDGGVRGAAVARTINNATVVFENIVNNAKVYGGDASGALAGYGAYGATITATKCINNADISGDNQVGGLFGYVQGSTMLIDSCENNGKVESTGNYAGGIISRFGKDAAVDADICTIKNCKNTGDVTSAKSQTGGMIGYTVGTIVIEKCTNSGAISNPAGSAGGISGAGSGKEHNGLLIKDCVNTGKITATTYAGGITGKGPSVAASGTGSYRIENCTNSGEVIMKGDLTSTGGASGIIGYLYGGSSENGVIGCTNTGKVTCDDTTTTYKDNIAIIAAGIIAYVNGTKQYIKDCTNTGEIKNLTVPIADGATEGGLPASVLLTVELFYNKNATGADATFATGNKVKEKEGVVYEINGEQAASYTFITETPVTPVVTGDSALIVMIIAAVSLLGMGIALRARKA